MATTQRYSGHHVGVSRDLTPSEEARLRRLAAKVAARPPWTDKKMRDNNEFRKVLISLYEDGVSAGAISRSLGWTQARVAMHVRQARLSGLATGSRRYIAPTSTDQKIKRDLTDDEIKTLKDMFGRIPRGGKDRLGMLKWKSAEGRELIEYAKTLIDNDVPLTLIATTLRMSKQALSLHVADGAKSKVPHEGTVRSVKASEAKSAQAKYEKLGIGHTGAKIWTTPEGLDLIDDLIKLIADGVPIATVYRKDVEGNRTGIRYRGIDDVLGAPSGALGRMIGMRDKIAERLAEQAG